MERHARDPQRCVGKTIREVKEWGFISEIVFTDDTKLRIEPQGPEAQEPELVYCADLSMD